MATDNDEKLTLINDDILSDEDITSYQVPNSASKILKILSTPASPPLSFLPSSLQSSLRGKSLRRSASLNKCSSKPESSIKYCSAPTIVQSNAFQSLGMNDKDISWVSSMESIVADESPRLEFNTVERATFLPCNEKNNQTQIQRRALFPSTSEDSLGLQPLDSSLTSDDGKSYTREIRLSDVCDILKTLDVKNPSSNEITDPNCYEFEVVNTLLCSPSLFSPRIQCNSLFSMCEVANQSSPIIRQSQGGAENRTKNSTVSSFASTPQLKSKLNLSPCIFSPSDAPSPIKRGQSKLHPIEESSSMEGSVLEIPLEETPNFNSQVQCESKINNKNEKTIEREGSAAKCLKFVHEPDVEKKDEQIDNKLFAVINERDGVLMKKYGNKQTKKLFGTSNNVTVFEASDIEDILKTLEENENASSQFFNCIIKDKKIFPKTDDIISFSDYLQTKISGSLEEGSLKRRAEVDISKFTKKVKDNNEGNVFRLPDKREKQMTPNHIKLEKSAWNSKNKHLIDSQVDVTDTQIFQICEEVELKIAKSNETKLKCLLTRKKGLGSRRNKKCLFADNKPENTATKDNCNDIKNTVEEKENNLVTKGGRQPVKSHHYDLLVNNAALVEDSKGNEVRSFDGFCTGSNKIVKPSTAAVDKVRNMFRDMDENASSEIMQEINNKKCDNELYDSNNKDDTTHIFNDLIDNSSKCENELIPPDKLVGFRTGNERAIQLSESSINRAKNIFNELENCEKLAPNSNIKNNNELDFVCDEVKNNLLEPTFNGFRTGNNSKVNPSKSSINKAQNIFDDIDLNEGLPEKNISVVIYEEKFEIPDVSDELESNQVQLIFNKFRTGNNNIVNPNKSSINKVRNIFDDFDLKEESPNDRVPVNSKLVGFQTGKSSSFIKPSEASLTKVRAWFADSNDYNTDLNSIISISEVAGNSRLVKSCKTSQDEDKNSSVDANVTTSNVTKPFLGFQTGNNKFVQPSSASLAKVKNIFENIDDDTKPNNNDKLEKSVLGFKTGNNQFIETSSTALAKVKNIFENMDEEIEESPGLKQVGSSNEGLNKTELPALGFKTGNNRFVKPSATALARVKNIFDNIDEIDENKTITDTKTNDSPSISVRKQPQTSAKFSGFSTANKNVIKPSEAALAKVKNIFDNIDEIGENKPISNSKTDGSANILLKEKSQISAKFGGFCTGNKNIIRPSEEALTKVRKMFEDDCENKKSHLQDITVGKQLVDNEIVTETEEPTRNENPVRKTQPNDSNFNKTKGNQTAKLDESYSTLLENTDWDDNIIPAWLHTSPGVNESDNSLFIHPATKRSASSDISLPCKRRKSDINEVLKKRQEARREQLQLGGKSKGKVKPQSGSYIHRKNLRRWQHLLSKGPERVQYNELITLKVEQDVLDINADNSKLYRFKAERFFCEYETNTDGFVLEDGFKLIFDDANSAGVEEFESCFLAGPGVEPGLVPVGWIAHHFSLIVWKLACYQTTCFKHLCKLPLTPSNVILQLKYRYDREVDLSESSALKRIVERDDSAGKPLVLTVMRVCKLVEGYELMLTDGWYTCPARTDCALDKAIVAGKLKVGTKLMTQGAELVGCEQGAPPLEMPKDAYLKISTNSTRRVRWYHKLGFQKLRFPPSVSLKSILPHGGIISCIRVAVVRAYPIVYVEKKKDGTRVTRNAKAESKAASLFMQEQESRMEKLYSQVQKEMAAKSSSKVRRVTRFSLNSISNLSAEELSDILENAPDPVSIEAILSEEQKEALWKYQDSRRFNAGKELQLKMEAEKMDKRDVRSVLRVRLVELNSPTGFSALLSWWQPAEDLHSLFVEGNALALFNVSPSNSSCQNQIYLNSSRGTRIEQLPTPSCSLPLRNILRIDNISSGFTPVLGEIDVVGLVVYIHSVSQGTLTMQTVYLSDTGQSFFGLVFWRGLQEFSCEDILAEGLVISASNVQWRRTSSSGAILCGYVTEFSLFTQKSKSPHIQTVIDQVKEDLEEEDIPVLIEKCQDEISTRLHSFKSLPTKQSNLSNTSVGNVSDLNDLGHVSVDVSILQNASPQPRPRYLNGFAQTPKASSTPVKTRTPAQRRIDKLQQFGEPPPLSPIPTCQPLKRKPFRVPLSKTTPR